MDMRKPANNYPSFSLLGLATVLTSPWKRVINTITSFRKEDPAEEVFVLMEVPDTEWFEKFDRSAEDFPQAPDSFAGKSAEEIRVIRQEIVSAIHASQSAITETINEIIHTVGNRSLDPGTKSAIRDNLDVRFNNLRRTLDRKENELDKCNTALSRMFTRRSSDKRTDAQSVHI